MIQITVPSAYIREHRFPYESEFFSGLETFEDQNLRYLCDLMKSILCVGYDYCLKDNPNGSVEEHYEYVFAYELYHQWSKYLDEFYLRENPNLRINGEIKKFFYEERKLPDLVLHEQGRNNQKLIVEIKTAHGVNPETVYQDIEKLIKFTSGRINPYLNERFIKDNYTPYEIGVFILTLKNSQELRDLILSKKDEIEELREDYIIHSQSIFLICVPERGNEGNPTLEVMTLQEVLGNNEYINN